MSPDEHPHSVINSAEVDLLVHSYLVESGSSTYPLLLTREG